MSLRGYIYQVQAFDGTLPLSYGNQFFEHIEIL